MSTWEFEETYEGPFEAEEPLAVLVEFYRTNGYERLDGGGDDASTPSSPVALTRGEEGAGWWSSDMTELYAEVTIEAPSSEEDDAVSISYGVETSGQYMTDSDRQFWRRELETARQRLHAPSGDSRDLRQAEKKRAERMEQSRLRYALWAAAGAFAFVIVARTMGCV